PQWHVYEQFLNSQKGKSGRIGEGYHRYEHGLEVAYLIYLATVKRGYPQPKIRQAVVAASLHDYHPRRSYEAPQVLETIKYLRKDRKLRHVLQKLGIDIPANSLIIKRTDHPWDEQKARNLSEGINGLHRTAKEKRSILEISELLQILDKASAYVYLPAQEADQRAKELNIEHKLQVSDVPRAQKTKEFLDQLSSDPQFDRVLRDLPSWAKKNWERNYAYFKKKSGQSSSPVEEDREFSGNELSKVSPNSDDRSGGRWPWLQGLYDAVGQGWFGQVLAPAILESGFFVGIIAIATAGFPGPLSLILLPLIPFLAHLWVYTRDWHSFGARHAFTAKDAAGLPVASRSVLARDFMPRASGDPEDRPLITAQEYYSNSLRALSKAGPLARYLARGNDPQTYARIYDAMRRHVGPVTGLSIFELGTTQGVFLFQL
ncbi:MAG: HD domain-containing protein, partial [Nitrospirota bacterium]